MKPSITVKSLLASFYHGAGWVASEIRSACQGEFLILMYHRIIPRDDAGDWVQAGMYVTPETFERHVLFLKEYFSLCPIWELPAGLCPNAPPRGSKPRCALTFDDGWKDFYQYAYPILLSHQVPATVFLPTDHIGSTNWFWTDRLAWVLRQKSRIGTPLLAPKDVSGAIVSRVANLKGAVESLVETAIEFLKALPAGEIEEILQELSSLWGISLNLPGRAFLSWDEVREMYRSGVVTFGSHTASHRILTTLTPEEVAAELGTSRRRLVSEGVVDPDFIPFCYPNGNYTAEIAAMVRDTGYALAVTTERGWNSPASDLFSLRRVGMHQDMAGTPAMFGCRIAGLL